MWKFLKPGMRKKAGDQVAVGPDYLPIPPEEVGKRVPAVGPQVRRWVKPAGRKLREGEDSARVRITVRIPRKAYDMLPEPKCSAAAAILVREISNYY